MTLHPVRYRLGVTALEVAVAGHRPDREEFRIAVIAQIEYARETGGGVARLIPESVAALRVGEIFDAARDRRMIDLARGHQAEHRPGGLRRGRRRALIAVVIEFVACAILAPAAVFVLYSDQPIHRAAHFRRGMIDAD